ncbi:Replication termination factor 2 [Entomophthora muscae]|uniref:Replication termination factor 2 n=1 Tax=Entomophthora muscae TaxID=34485 RepID=A0ACC2UD09_9FUNG|nr:Replication termination factor 2 [Entomophthora muscae]
MGNDGGSILKRCELVKTKKKAVKFDPSVGLVTRWFLCALSKKPLESPVVICELGKLYNKESLLEYFINKKKYGDADKICGHIRSLGKVRTLKLMDNPQYKGKSGSASTIAPFICPLTLKEMNGKYKFVYLQSCCCAFSETGLKEMHSHSNLLCPLCNAPYSPDDVTEICPPQEVQDQLIIELQAKREALSAKKAKKRAEDSSEATVIEPSKKIKMTPAQQAPSTKSDEIISNLLLAKEKSSAIKSIYASNKASDKKAQNFLCRGTFNRYA